MDNQNHRILIVDDEENLCEILQFNIEGEGYLTEVVNSAEDALNLNLSTFNLILLDVMMGGISGFKFADKIRKDGINVPIIFLTAKNTENDMLTGFNVGGDDYIKKPFSIKEVITRINVILNRTKKQTFSNEQILNFNELTININNKSVCIAEKNIDLTKKEFEILVLLLSNKDKIFNRYRIMDNVWENDVIVSDRTIDVHITRLRKKLGSYGKNLLVKSGYGYYFSTQII